MDAAVVILQPHHRRKIKQANSILSYSILFYSIQFNSILFCSVLLRSALLYRILFCFILTNSSSHHSCLLHLVPGRLLESFHTEKICSEILIILHLNVKYK